VPKGEQRVSLLRSDRVDQIWLDERARYQLDLRQPPRSGSGRRPLPNPQITKKPAEINFENVADNCTAAFRSNYRRITQSFHGGFELG